MKYPHGSNRVAGLLLPLSALRTRDNLGVGEFTDLPVLGEWCSRTGLRLIQLLPVNDSGDQSSPYSTLSALALHPIHLNISSLPELQSSAASGAIKKRLSQLRKQLDGAGRFSYPEILYAKMALLREIWESEHQSVLDDPAFAGFIASNPWVRTYGVFRTLKDQFDGRAWREWPEEFRDPEETLVDRLWDEKGTGPNARFYAWLQMRLAEQFRGAAEALSEMGIALKGDIPILMNEDSADVWYHRAIFDLSLTAGAPPDMFSALGQNWRFPIYDWEALAARDYDWWRLRLREAQRYYHAYRIDHVLGFFRIWAIPATDDSGVTGVFKPQTGITTEDLRSIGFDEGRIRWLAEPHLRGEELRSWISPDLIDRIFTRIGEEDLFLFRSDLAGEQEIESILDRSEAREELIAAWRDRALTAIGDDRYAATWYFRECSRYISLGNDEKDRFEQLVARTSVRDNELWADHGRRLLSVMQESTDMLACAEDLGVIPEAVPRVLSELGILGLRISRWAHYWDQPGQPLIRAEEYPELTVCAPSVHDTSTLRDWWENEEGRRELWRVLGETDPLPATFDPDVARVVLGYFAAARSRIVVYQLQDLLALVSDYRVEDASRERVNVPGTYDDFNWTWRMPIPVEEMRENAALIEHVASIVEKRG